jgi:hypothetical protein
MHIFTLIIYINIFPPHLYLYWYYSFQTEISRVVFSWVVKIEKYKDFSLKWAVQIQIKCPEIFGMVGSYGNVIMIIVTYLIQDFTLFVRTVVWFNVIPTS